MNEVAEAEERASACQRVKGLFDVFEPVPHAQQWLDLFKQEQDRYPFLVVLGPPRSRKTEWAKPLFQNPLQLDVGTLEDFPDGMRAFSRQVHDGIFLDGVRDFRFPCITKKKCKEKSTT